jgi:hypothetical protein
MVGVTMLSMTAAAAVLESPVVVELKKEKRDPHQLLGAAADAAAKDGWTVNQTDRDSLSATTEWNNRHVVQVKLTATPESVAISYLNSKELDYEIEDGVPHIHRGYNKKVGNLSDKIENRMKQLCPDLTGQTAAVGSSFDDVAKDIFLSNPKRTLSVTSSSGEATGYTIREYVAYYPNGRIYDCGQVSATYYKGKFVSMAGEDAAVAALNAYTDMLNYLVDRGDISFSDAELERIYQKAQMVSRLDPARRAELLSFVEWQLQRLSNKELSQKEYSYLVAQKEAEVEERQSSLDMKEAELGQRRAALAMQADQLNVQRKQLSVQRSMAIGVAIANISNAQQYRPSLNCHSTSRALLGTVQTDMTCQ